MEPFVVALWLGLLLFLAIDYDNNHNRPRPL